MKMTSPPMANFLVARTRALDQVSGCPYSPSVRPFTAIRRPLVRRCRQNKKEIQINIEPSEEDQRLICFNREIFLDERKER